MTSTTHKSLPAYPRDPNSDPKDVIPAIYVVHEGEYFEMLVPAGKRGNGRNPPQQYESWGGTAIQNGVVEVFSLEELPDGLILAQDRDGFVIV